MISSYSQIERPRPMHMLDVCFAPLRAVSVSSDRA